MSQFHTDKLPSSLQRKLDVRINTASLRSLRSETLEIDFSSNDYLGFATSEEFKNLAHQIETEANLGLNSSTGSRLIRGNHKLYQKTEEYLSSYYKVVSALIFNSGYDANLGLFSSISTKASLILYDELCHASIRDGIRLGQGKAFKFKHNDVDDLATKLTTNKEKFEAVYVVTEAVFSMDGDGPNLNSMLSLCKENNAYLIIDEAHSNPIFPLENLISKHELTDVFARVVTFGKAFGVHGAAVLGSKELTSFLVNFARSFIYTTALSPSEVAKIYAAHQLTQQVEEEVSYLKDSISFFRSMCFQLKLTPYFIESFSPIQSCVIPGNEKVEAIAEELQQRNFDVRAIKSPTVPEGQERLRICLHSYNFPAQIEALLKLLKEGVTKHNIRY